MLSPNMTNINGHTRTQSAGNTTHSHSSGEKLYTHTSKAQFTASFSFPVFRINHHACISGICLSQKVNADMVPLQCTCVYLSPKWAKSMRANREKHWKYTPRPKHCRASLSLSKHLSKQKYWWELGVRTCILSWLPKQPGFPWQQIRLAIQPVHKLKQKLLLNCAQGALS